MPPVVALDANILVPIIACDFLLTAFDRHLIEPIVSELILDEVERTLIEDFPRLDPIALRRTVGHMVTKRARMATTSSDHRRARWFGGYRHHRLSRSV